MRLISDDSSGSVHALKLTPQALAGLRSIADGLGESIEKLLEDLGRGKLVILSQEDLRAVGREPEILQDALDSALLRAAVAEGDSAVVDSESQVSMSRDDLDTDRIDPERDEDLTDDTVDVMTYGSDDTEHLLSSPANAALLYQALTEAIILIQLRFHY